MIFKLMLHAEKNKQLSSKLQGKFKSDYGGCCIKFWV